MMSGWWDRPIRVDIGAGKAVNVSNNEQAAQILLGEWPGDTGARHLRAREAVLRALERPDDPGPSIAAQRAFAAAAEEAHILLPDLPKSVAPAGSKTPRWAKRRR